MIIMRIVKKSSSFILFIALFSSFLLVSAIPRPSLAKKKDTPQRVDYIAIASRLLSDGFVKRALNVLKGVDPVKEKLNLPLYYTILGLAYTQNSQFSRAVDSFKLSIENGQTDPSVYIYMANCHYRLKDYRKTLSDLEMAGDLGISRPKYILLRSDCLWKLREPAMAIYWLDRGKGLFPYESIFLKQKFYYLMELRLYKGAIDVAREIIKNGDYSKKDYILIAKALVRAKRLKDARDLLWEGSLLFPDSPSIQVALANVYVKLGKISSSAMRFEALSMSIPKYARDASELYKRAHFYSKALYLNSKVLDQRSKILQKMGILLDLRAFDMVVNMLFDLKRTGLLEDDRVKYAYAYALVHSENLKEAQSLLEEVKSPTLFPSVLRLRQIIDQCKREGSECP